jgi:hypothetical protein
LRRSFTYRRDWVNFPQQQERFDNCIDQYNNDQRQSGIRRTRRGNPQRGLVPIRAVAFEPLFQADLQLHKPGLRSISMLT